METDDGRLSVSKTLRALKDVLAGKVADGARGAAWFKESSSRNLRSRDFLAPQAALRAVFGDGQVPDGIVKSVLSLKCPGVPPIQCCQNGLAGLTVQLDRTAVFADILKAIPSYAKPPQIALGGPCVVLNCVPLHGCKGLNSFSLNHLRAILVTDHLAGVLQAQGVDVHLVPALADEETRRFLRQLQIEWPSGLEMSPSSEDFLTMKDALRQCPHATFAEMDEEGAMCRLHLRGFLGNQEQQKDSLEGYDPNLDVFLVTEEKLLHVAELQRAASQCAALAPGRCYDVVHVVSHEEAFQQQKVDLLWRLVAPQVPPASQKHLVCGPVKVAAAASPVSVLQYFQVRHSQMYEASVLKYGDLSQDESWTETISVLMSAAIRFEMLSTAHSKQKFVCVDLDKAIVLGRSSLVFSLISFLREEPLVSVQKGILLDLEEASISTKGTKSGAFVMYNCARLATLFETYQREAEKGTYPAFPLPSELDYSSLREEGEWLLVFNSILPFSEVLSQVVQLPISSSGIRITASTEAVCKFLIQLSMDFSSYYNRVHILGEPRPHLFSQMFARLQLMRAVREVFHSALMTLHLPPLNQI